MTIQRQKILREFLDTGNVDKLIDEYAKINIQQRDMSVGDGTGTSPARRASNIRRSTQHPDLPTDKITPQFVDGVPEVIVTKYNSFGKKSLHDTIKDFEGREVPLSGDERIEVNYIRNLYKYRGGKRN